MREKLGIGDDELLITQVRRTSKQKNRLFSLGVMELFLEQNPKARCVFFGDINDKSMDDAIRIAQNKRIRLYPPDAENIDAIYDASDIVFVPSLAEGGLSFVAVEAARSGCQVFMNESLGRIEGDLSNVHYLPLAKEAWINELEKISTSKLANRQTQDLPVAYSLERSMSQYLELFGNSDIS